MTEWQPIETAPRDGTPIQARIFGHGDDNVIAWHGGLVDADGRDCASWNYLEDREPPACWTDGICWVENDEGNPSVLPTHWKPLTR